MSTICVVLDQSTVTFQKGWGRGLLQFVSVVLDQRAVIFSNGGRGRGSYYNLCGIGSKSGNVMFYKLVANLSCMFPS